MALNLDKVIILPRAMRFFKEYSFKFKDDLNFFKEYCLDLIYTRPNGEKDSTYYYVEEVMIDKGTKPENRFLVAEIINYASLPPKRIRCFIYKIDPDNITNSHIHSMVYEEIHNKDFKLTDVNLDLLEEKGAVENSEIIQKMTEKTFGDTVGSRRVGRIIKGL
ncbi:MAG: hypothetical protein EBU90_00950 [Proteobacteria bacterium]|nr:hypothetical protein [Pseudomonadota bacterium]NBP13001.1 hypothetical protein [bacterium]